MSETMPVKNIMAKLLKENEITPYAFWKAIGISQNAAYRLCNDPDSIPGKRIMDKIYEVYNWLPGDYLASDKEWDAWFEFLTPREQKEIKERIESYVKKTKNEKDNKEESSKLIDFPIAA